MPIGDYKLQLKRDPESGEWIRGVEPWEDEQKHPLGFKCRFVTVDVQQTSYWCLCRSWGKYGKSRLYAFQRCWSEAEVDDFRKNCEVGPELTFVDTGYDPKDPDSKGAMWGRVMKMCAKYGFVATNGIGQEMFKHENGDSKIYSPLKKIDAWEGEKIGVRRPKVHLLQYSSRGAKFLLHSLRTEKDETGNTRWTVAMDASEEYKLQAYAERLRKKKLSKGGVAWEWFQIRDDNHAFDNECVQCVIAVVFKIIGAEAAETAAPETMQEAAAA